MFQQIRTLVRRIRHALIRFDAFSRGVPPYIPDPFPETPYERMLNTVGRCSQECGPTIFWVQGVPDQLITVSYGDTVLMSFAFVRDDRIVHMRYRSFVPGHEHDINLPFHVSAGGDVTSGPVLGLEIEEALRCYAGSLYQRAQIAHST